MAWIWMRITFNLDTVSLLLLLNFATISKAQGPTYLYNFCDANKTTPNSPFFKKDLNTLLSSLSSNATANTDFFNTTVPGRNPNDTAYGLFMCRGDFSSCGHCVVNATQKLSSDSDCTLSKRAIIWYDECMVWYSNNRSILSTFATRPGVYLSNTGNVSNQESFMKLLFRTMNETAQEAAKSPVLEKKYFTRQANISGFQNLYCMAQCTDNLTPQDCTSCLTEAITELTPCCSEKQGGRVLFPSCFVRYELYPFYESSSLAPSSPADSKDTQDPVYISRNCSTDAVDNSSLLYQSRLRTLLANLSSITASGVLFSKGKVEGTVYGLFMCRDDLPPILCSQCVGNASDKISSDCGSSYKEAIIWYSHCLLRYSSSESILSIVETNPRYVNLNIINTTDPSQKQSVYFTSSNILYDVAKQAAYVDNHNKYATNKSRLNPSQWLYTLAQCTPNLSPENCNGCLNTVIASIIENLNSASVTGRILTPSCNIRFEFFRFYRDALANQPPSLLTHPSSSKENEKGHSQTIILIVVPSFVSVILLCFGCYLLRIKIRKSSKHVLKANFGDESATLEPLQFGLAVIKAATNNFSLENRIGKGGFGEVFQANSSKEAFGKFQTRFGDNGAITNR
ncbi:hypothetical protein PIB30_119169 [Stylosanthes scabra]|uniref:Gnk2-homologous domain-containing protein n=1 Tax=Stylosanthes scabra TaxID=79078 RepID=A0ABU6YNL9_9FABA|nr:hypothetical protein [Stylosanthes scabra]